MPATEYVLYFIIIENIFQYSLNLYHLTQIFFTQEEKQEKEEQEEQKLFTYKRHLPI
jgi:hypothetical protein